MIDTHAHLNFSSFDQNFDRIIKESQSKGISGIVIPGSNLETSRRAVQLAQKYPNVYAAVGIHPIHAKDYKKIDFVQITDSLQKLASNKKVVAIGECGLDRYRTQNSKPGSLKAQKQVFQTQISLAQKLHLPLIIHNRQADDDVLNILCSKFDVRCSKIVFHSFEGQPKIWQYVRQQPNAYIGLNGLLTYNPILQKAVKQIPLAKIVLETDSPYLRPRNGNEKLTFPNTPQNVKIVARFLADLKDSDVETVDQTTTDNAKIIFNL